MQSEHAVPWLVKQVVVVTCVLVTCQWSTGLAFFHISIHFHFLFLFPLFPCLSLLSCIYFHTHSVHAQVCISLSLWVMKAIPVKLQWSVPSNIACSPWKWAPFTTVEEWIGSARPFSSPWIVSAAFILTSLVFQESRHHLNFLHRDSSQCDRSSWVKEKSSFKLQAIRKV